ncbi:MAG: hypothetical protein ACK5XA_08585 [Tagaea sp.]
MSKKIPHYQQVGSRDPVTGERREWRAGEHPMRVKGNKLNPRRLIKVRVSRAVARRLFKTRERTLGVSVDNAMLYLHQSPVEIKKSKGWR